MYSVTDFDMCHRDVVCCCCHIGGGGTMMTHRSDVEYSVSAIPGREMRRWFLVYLSSLFFYSDPA